MIKELTSDWITKEPIDHEQKIYILLSYLNFVNEKIENKKLFPYIKNLKILRDNIELIKHSKNKKRKKLNNKEIHSIDLQKEKINYKEKEKESDILKEIDNIIEDALLKIDPYQQKAKEIKKEIKKNIDIKIATDVIPNEKKQGFILVDMPYRTRAYRFFVRDLHFTDVSKKIKTKFIKDYNKRSNIQNFKKIKDDLLSEVSFGFPMIILANNNDLKEDIPLTESFIPMIKEKMLKDDNIIEPILNLNDIY